MRLKEKAFFVDAIQDVLFQFQSGAIKSKVAGVALFDTDKFQFQSGAIKRPFVLAEFENFYIGFNSNLVRLKAPMEL